jgi:hypothetical protein
MDKSNFNNKTEWKKFAIGVAIILTLVASVQWYLDIRLYVYFIVAAIVILLFGLFLPIVIKPLFIAFSYLGFVLGWIMTRLILSLLYYLVFTPIGWILKLTGKRLLDTSFKPEQESYWIKRPEGVEMDFTKQF